MYKPKIDSDIRRLYVMDVSVCSDSHDQKESLISAALTVDVRLII